jgi:hypothetical protein
MEYFQQRKTNAQVEFRVFLDLVVRDGRTASDADWVKASGRMARSGFKGIPTAI